MLTLIVALAASLQSAPARASARHATPVTQAPQAAEGPSRARVVAAYGALGLSFEANRGQVDERVRFLARGEGYTLFLTTEEAVLALEGAGETPLRLRLRGSSRAAEIVGRGEQTARSNYFRGADPSGWHLDIPNYSTVRCRGVYPGVDVEYYGTRQRLEYDLLVAPGADPGAIGLDFEGAGRVAIDRGGDLLLRVGARTVRQRRPVAYQETDGARRPVACRYVRRGRGAIGLRLGRYDAGLALVIDPVLTYSSYLGGSMDEVAYGVAVDSSGAAYVTGITKSPNFPTAGATQGAFGGGAQDAFVLKLNRAGNAVVFATYLGGSGDDVGAAVGVDGEEAVYVTGWTNSSNFPVVNALQPTAGGGYDAFVTKLAPTGSSLVYSTFLGGSGDEGVDANTGNFAAMAVEETGSVYVAGQTHSANFPTTPGALQRTLFGDGRDAFVAKLNPAGSALVYSTFFGGSGSDSGTSIAVDAAGNACLGGYTGSQDLPTTAGAFQPQYSGAAFGDGFVAKLNPAGSAVLLCSYIGGASGGAGGPANNFVSGVGTDLAGNVFIAGGTSSVDFPTANAFQGALKGDGDAFVAKIAQSGGLLYSTFLGGTGREQAYGLVVDLAGDAYVVGSTSSNDFPTASAVQPAYAGGDDGFVAKLRADGSGLSYATYLGGSGTEIARAVAIDLVGDAYVAGVTSSNNFPTIGAVQGRAGGANDAWIAKISDAYALQFDPPDPAAGANAPPRFLVAKPTTSAALASAADTQVGGPRSPGSVIAYKVYRASSANVQPSPGNLYTTLPPTQTSTGPITGGGFFVVTACYPGGGESGPSNVAGAGVGEAVIKSLKVKSTKITATGTGFTTTVDVAIDGIAFGSAAAVKKSNTKAVQKGALTTGQSIGDYIQSRGGTVLLSFRNSNGGIATIKLGP